MDIESITLWQGYKGWIIWDKGQRGLTMSDCEIIYSNFDYPTSIEKDQDYWKARVERLKNAQAQMKLF